MRKGFIGVLLILALAVSAFGVKLTIDSYERRNHRSEAVRVALESLNARVEPEFEAQIEEAVTDIPEIEVIPSVSRYELPSNEIEPFEGVTLADYHVRNKNDEIIATTYPGDTVQVLGTYNAERIWVRYNGMEGSILNKVLPAKNVAICINELNLRDENGNIIVLIPRGELVTPLEPINLSNERTQVKWNGKIGTVLTEGLQRSFVLIDIDNQFVALYIEGDHFVSGKTVTGNTSTGCDTPRGLYYLLGRDEDTDLVGPDWSAHVKYWMPFAINGKIGMHDASWRTEFGGDIYKTAGSHGCVNLPEKLAETIFENIYVGFPIVVK
jgi:hypothetical protein